MNKQKRAVPPEFLLLFVVLNLNNPLVKFNSLVGRKWMSSPTVEGHPCSKVSKTNLQNIYYISYKQHIYIYIANIL